MGPGDKGKDFTYPGEEFGISLTRRHLDPSTSSSDSDLYVTSMSHDAQDTVRIRSELMSIPGATVVLCQESRRFYSPGAATAIN